MDVNTGIEPQQAVDDRASNKFFPVAARGLAPHELGYLPLVSNLYELASNVGAAGADYFSPQVFGEYGVFFQAAQRLFPALFRLALVLEPSYELTGEGQVALRLDTDSDEIGVQAMRKPPGVADHLARMRPRIKAHQHALSSHPVFADAMPSHILL